MRRPTAGNWSRSDGGVCNNCGEPQFAHVADVCPDDERVASLADPISRWRQRIEPAKRLKDKARDELRRMRNMHRKGWTSIANLERAEVVYEMCVRHYHSLIAEADRRAEQGE